MPTIRSKATHRKRPRNTLGWKRLVRVHFGSPCSRFSAFVAPSSKLGMSIIPNSQSNAGQQATRCSGPTPRCHTRAQITTNYYTQSQAAPRSRAPRYCPMTLCSLSFSDCWKRCGRTKRSIGSERQGVFLPHKAHQFARYGRAHGPMATRSHTKVAGSLTLVWKQQGLPRLATRVTTPFVPR